MPNSGSALILGGTAFAGIALREALLRRGFDVTLFNRGVTAATPPEGVRTVTGDRTHGFDGLENEHFDAVIDTSGYLPHVVERSSDFFRERCKRYVFVSSISVFDATHEELDEASPMPPLPDGASRTEMTPETYGPLKALCEGVVADAFGSRATIVRPGLIVGPNDRTDRFTYWPVRMARGGQVLAPGAPERRAQFVDVRDLAEFLVGLVERAVPGDFNVTSPQGLFTLGDVLATCASVADVPSHVTWVDDGFLVENQVAPWTGLPLWIPPSEGIPGLLNANVRKAVDAGLTIRPLRRTAADTLAWAMQRPSDYVPRCGLSAEREAELLQQFASA